MGAQIAEFFSRVGKCPVGLWDINDELVNKGLDSIQNDLRRFFLEKGKMSESEFNEVVKRIKGTTSIPQAAKQADFVVEAVVEDINIKKNIFKQLDDSAPAHAILATNTSALNITEISEATSRRDKVIGAHFFNPVGVMKLVEVVRGSLTSDDTVDFTCSFMRKLGKDPIVCKDFSFEFVANRAYRAMRNEALQILWERVATPADIDKALKLGFNLPMGPLELGDFTGGWGVEAASDEAKIKATGKGVHPLIKILVRAGYPGGRGKKGVYAFWDEVMSKS
jgi:3-hydroxybutyryl-CoA dehydrogenase